MIVNANALRLPYRTSSFNAALGSPPYAMGIRKYHGEQGTEWPEVAEIDRQAMFDPGDFMEWGGVYETETGGAGIVKLRPSEDLSPGVRRLITGVSVSAKGTLTVKTVDKQRAQELALKHRGLLRDAAAVDVPAGATVTITVPDNERAG